MKSRAESLWQLLAFSPYDFYSKEINQRDDSRLRLSDLKDLKKYNLPIYITENGLADTRDEYRTDFIKGHLYYVHKAIEEGVDVRGYLHWSLLDNFEWDKGFWPRFGLIEVDYKTLARKVRYSALLYGDICEKNGFEV